MPRRSLTLAQYILKRNGVPAGAPHSLRNMLARSLGAATFAGFWRHWNPVFGYALGKYVFNPLKQALPSWLALLSTFVLCGALHDLVTMAVRGGPAFFFIPWFFFMGAGVLLGNAVGLSFAGQPWGVRAAANVAYVSGCLGLTVIAGRLAS